MGKEISKKHEKAINEFVKECKKKFGENLISVVLFGSVARGTATKYSDIDLLVVVKDLPADWRKRDKLLDDVVMNILLKHQLRIFPIITTPKAIINSQEIGNPLFYGILTGYKKLFDKNSFFEGVMNNVRLKVNAEKPIFYDKVGKWELAKM